MNGLRDDVVNGVRGAGVVAWTAFAIGAAFVGLVVLVVAGSTLTDLGGWRGLGITAAWLLCTVGLATLGLLRPSAAVPTLAVLTLLPVGFGVWSLIDYDGAGSWEDSHGPVSLVLTVVVAAGLMTLGLARPAPAGVLLLVASVAPAILASIGAGSDWLEPLAIALITLPLVVTAVLFLVAARHPADERATLRPPTSVAH